MKSDDERQIWMRSVMSVGVSFVRRCKSLSLVSRSWMCLMQSLMGTDGKRAVEPSLGYLDWASILASNSILFLCNSLSQASSLTLTLSLTLYNPLFFSCTSLATDDGLLKYNSKYLAKMFLFASQYSLSIAKYLQTNWLTSVLAMTLKELNSN